MLDGNGGYCDGDEEGFNGEPFIIGPDGKQTYKYPELIITEMDYDGTYNVHYPTCKKCRQQYWSKKDYKINIVFTIYETGVIDQTIYYDRGNLIVVKNRPTKYECSTCLEDIDWYLYRFDDTAPDQGEKVYRYEIIPSGNTDFNHSLTVLPYKGVLKNIYNTIYTTEHMGGVLFHKKNIYIPKVPIREQVGEMSILTDGRGAMGFETQSGEIVILDEFGQNVDYDKYAPIANYEGLKYTYGNEFFNIIVSPYSHEKKAKSIILSGKHTKSAARIVEEGEED